MIAVFRWIRRRIALVVLATALVAVISVVLAPRGTASYTATARFFATTGANSKGPGAANEAITYAQELALAIPASDTVLGAARDLGLDQTEMASRLSVSSPANTNMIVVAFTDNSPSRAVHGAQEVADTITHDIPSVAPVGSIAEVAGPALRSVTVTRATSTTEHLALGIGIGLLLGLVVALAWDRRDRRVDDVAELSRVIGTPATSLSRITKWQAHSLRRRWVVSHDRTGSVISLVTCPSHVPDPLPALRAGFRPVADATNFRLLEVDERFLDDMTVARSQDGSATVLFAGRMGTDSAVASLLVADLVVLAVTEGTRERDVANTLRMLAEQDVALGWGLLVARQTARASARRSWWRRGRNAPAMTEVAPTPPPVPLPGAGPRRRPERLDALDSLFSIDEPAAPTPHGARRVDEAERSHSASRNPGASVGQIPADARQPQRRSPRSHYAEPSERRGWRRAR